jgi:2-polyprenyl-3-methyl-5-hydroxy-6-metoxy-1,4-benzoquinol methylase
MDRLTNTLELLDGPLDDRSAVAANLRDLRRVNRLLGGVDLSWRALAALVGDPSAAGRAGGGSPVTLLDVGTGAADIPVALVARARREGRPLEITAIDSRPEILTEALASSPGLAQEPGVRLSVGDGRALAQPDRSFDVVHSSMVIHHLEPDEAVAFLREMARVASRGVIVNDLVRSRLGWVGAWLISHLLTRSRYTRNDAPLSVRRAYTVAELGELLATAGLVPVARFRGPFAHRWAIAAVAGQRS